MNLQPDDATAALCIRPSLRIRFEGPRFEQSVGVARRRNPLTHLGTVLNRLGKRSQTAGRRARHPAFQPEAHLRHAVFGPKTCPKHPVFRLFSYLLLPCIAPKPPKTRALDAANGTAKVSAPKSGTYKASTGRRMLPSTRTQFHSCAILARDRDQGNRDQGNRDQGNEGARDLGGRFCLPTLDAIKLRQGWGTGCLLLDTRDDELC